MDAIVAYLPSPLDRPETQLLCKRKNDLVALKPIDSEPLSALAFKVIHDPHRGPLVFVRVYSGIMQTRTSLINASRGVKERATRLLQVHSQFPSSYSSHSINFANLFFLSFFLIHYMLLAIIFPWHPLLGLCR